MARLRSSFLTVPGGPRRCPCCQDARSEAPEAGNPFGSVWLMSLGTLVLPACAVFLSPSRGMRDTRFWRSRKNPSNGTGCSQQGRSGGPGHRQPCIWSGAGGRERLGCRRAVVRAPCLPGISQPFYLPSRACHLAICRSRLGLSITNRAPCAGGPGW